MRANNKYYGRTEVARVYKTLRQIRRLLLSSELTAYARRKLRILIKRLNTTRGVATCRRTSLLLSTLSGVCFSLNVYAQAPTIQSLTPDANATSANRNANIEIKFSKTMWGPSVTGSTIRIYGSQTGLRSSDGVFSGESNRKFNPDLNFYPGEVLSVTVTTDAESVSSGPLAEPKVYQFSAGVSGNGRGFFAERTLNAGFRNRAAAVVDLDGDLDLDLLTASRSNQGYHIFLNNGNNTFTSERPVDSWTYDITVGDFDGDGDVDVIGANANSTSNDILLNNGDGTFTASTFGPAGIRRGVDSGDLDGDGDLDVVFSATNNAAHELWLNNGDATFSSSTFGGGDSERLAIGDLDNDGDLDIIVAGDNESQEIWLNNGDASFISSSFGSGTSRAIELGDLDGDGDLDAIIANVNEPQDIWLNNGDATFTTSTFGSGNSLDLALGDLDADGDLDAIIVNSEEAQEIWYNNGDGTFSSRAFGSGKSEGVGLGDLDGDGDLDAVICNSIVRELAVWYNAGELALSSASPTTNAGAVAHNANLSYTFNTLLKTTHLDNTSIPTQANLILYGNQSGYLSTGASISTDLGDTRVTIDPARSFFAGEQITVIFNDVQSTSCVVLSDPSSAHAFRAAAIGGTAVFSTSATDLGQRSRAAATGDYDNDGDVDVLIGNSQEFPFRFARNNGDGTFNISQFGAGTVLDLVAADLDGDGDLDAIAANGNNHAQDILLNNGDGSFAVSSFGNTTTNRGLDIGDLDGDGDLDAIIATRDGSGQEIWLNKGDGTFTSSTFGGGNSEDLALGDLDGDGDLDAIIVNSNEPQHIWLNNGDASFASSTFSGADSRGIAIWDLDGDGDLDAIIANSNDDQHIWLNNGDATFICNDFGTGKNQDVALGDLDGDGDMDAIFAVDDGPQNIWLNNGDGTFISSTLGSGKSHGVAIGDLDGDRDLDAIILNRDNEDSEFWFNLAGQPTVSSLAPPSFEATPAAVQLTVNGEQFYGTSAQLTVLNSSGVTNGSINLTISSGSPTQFVADLPAGVLATIGTLTLTVDNEVGTTSTTLTVTNDTPVISTNQTTVYLSEDQASVISFTLNDFLSTAADLTLISPTADLTTIASITQQGATAATSKVVITPVSNANGSLPLTFQLSDGNRIGSTTINLTINPVNDPPVIATYNTSLAVARNRSTIATFNLSDVDTPFNNLILSATSNNLSVVTSGGLILGVAGASTDLLIDPVENATGSAVIIVSVDDGEFMRSTSFTLDVGPDDMFLRELNPITNANAVSINSNLRYTFSNSLDLNNLNATSASTQANILVYGNQSGRISTLATITTELNDTRLVIDPAENFFAGEELTVILNDVQNTSNVLQTDLEAYRFRATVAAGTAVFSTTAVFAGGRANSAAIGDYDQDGDLDAIVANGTGRPYSLMKNDGAGVFAVSEFGGKWTNDIAAGDLDGDGDLDAVAANGFTQKNEILLNRGDGTFQISAFGTANISRGVAVGDLDGDGDLDAMFTNASNEGLQLWLNNGNATFVESILGAGDNTAIGFGDLDGDGDLDVVIGNNGTAQDILLNNGDATFTSSTFGSGKTHDLAIGDLDNDGDLDVIIANSTEAQDIWLNNGDATFTSSAFGSGTSQAVELGDFDKDGDLDAIIANLAEPQDLWINDGNATFTSSSIGSGKSTGVAIGDLNEDGDLDALILNTSNQDIHIWTNTETLPTISSINPATTTASLSATQITVDGTELVAPMAKLSVLNSSGVTSGTIDLTILSSTRGSFTAVIPAGAFATIGTLSLTVSNGTGQVSSNLSITNDSPLISTSQTTVAIDEDVPSIITLSLIDADPGINNLTVLLPVADLTTIASISQQGATAATTQFLVTPVANTSGTVPLTFQVSDGSLSSTTTINLTVRPVDDPPVIATNNTQISIAEDRQTVATFTLEDIDTEFSNLILSASSSNLSLINHSGLTFGATGATSSLFIDPIVDASGSAMLTVTVDDGESLRSTTFTLSVMAQNDPPEITLSSTDLRNQEDESVSVNLQLCDVDTPFSNVFLTATSSNQSLLRDDGLTLTATSAITTLNMIPVTNASGTALITISADDGEFVRSTSLSLRLDPVNDPPMISTNNAFLVTAEDTPTTASFILSDVDTPITNLILRATSSNPALVTNGGLTLSATTATPSLVIAPVADASGNSIITLTVDDGEFTRNLLLQLNVGAVNDPPVVTAGASAIVVDEDNATSASLILVDNDTQLSNISLTATSSNLALIPNEAIRFGTSGGITPILLTPAANANGSARITVRADDGDATHSTSFSVTVNPINDPPAIAVPHPLGTINQNGTTTLVITLSDIDSPFNQLVLYASSANQSLLPDSDITFGVTASTVELNVTPQCGKTGSAAVNIQVSDGEFVRNTSFTLLVQPVEELSITGSNCACPGVTTQFAALPIEPLAAHFWSVKGGIVKSGQGTGEVEIIWSNSANVAELHVTRTSIAGCTNSTTLLAQPKNLSAVADFIVATRATTAIEVLNNDTGNSLQLTSVGPAAFGSASTAGKVINYTANAEFNGIETLTYTVQSDEGCRATAAVVIVVPAASVPNASINFVNRKQDRIDEVRGLGGAASAVVSHDGRYVYVAGRKDHSIAMFERNTSTGRLTYVKRIRNLRNGVLGLKYPEYLAIDPQGFYVFAAGYGDNALVIFERDQTSGELSFVERKKYGRLDNGLAIRGMKRPRNLVVSHDGKSVYVSGNSDNTVSHFQRNDGTGKFNYIHVHKDNQAGVNGLRRARGLAVSTDGKHAYIAGYGEHSLAGFERNTLDGSLDFNERYRDGHSGVDGLAGVIDVTISPDGLHVYTAGYIDDAIALFERNSNTGELTFVEVYLDSDEMIEGLNGVRGIQVSSDGAYLWSASEIDDAIVLFKRDLVNGRLKFMKKAQDGDGDFDGLNGATMPALWQSSAEVYVPGFAENSVATLRRNRQPNAVNDLVGPVARNATLSISPLSNDSDPDGHMLAITSTSAPQLGTVSIKHAGTTIEYIAGNTLGMDQFSYSIGDYAGGSSTATVSVRVVNAKLGVTTISIDTISQEDISVLPNPARDFVNVNFVLDHASAARLSLFDLHGRELSSIDVKTTHTGLNSVDLHLRDDRGARIPAGTYFVKLNYRYENGEQRTISTTLSVR